MPGNVGVTSEFSVPDTSAGRLDKLQIPSQSFFRCRLINTPREGRIAEGKSSPSFLASFPCLTFLWTWLIAQSCFPREYFWGMFSFTSLKLSDIKSYASLSLHGRYYPPTCRGRRRWANAEPPEELTVVIPHPIAAQSAETHCERLGFPLQSIPYDAISAWASSAGQTWNPSSFNTLSFCFSLCWERHLSFFLSLCLSPLSNSLLLSLSPSFPPSLSPSFPPSLPSSFPPSLSPPFLPPSLSFSREQY